MVNLGECFFDHFERAFPGRLVGRKRYPLALTERELQVLYYDNCFDGCRVFVTLGMTHVGLSPPCELMVVADREWDAIPAVLAACVSSIMAARSSGWGYLVRDLDACDPGFVSRTGKRHLYVTLPHALPEKWFFRVDCGEVEGCVFQGLFVGAAEADYIVREGAESFEREMVREEVDVFAVMRDEMRLNRAGASGV